MRTGKISSLPFVVRTELNQRLRDAQHGVTLLPWLNSLPTVRAILARDFENRDVNQDNLKVWCRTGYRDWLKQQDRLHHTSMLAERSVELARACGGNITEGASALLAGQIFEVLELLGDVKAMISVDADKDSPAPGDESGGEEGLQTDKAAQLASTAAALGKLTRALVALRQADQKNIRLAQIERDLNRKDEAFRIVTQKFQRDTCELYIRWSNNRRAAELAASDISHAEKIAALGQLMFGDDWQPISDGR